MAKRNCNNAPKKPRARPRNPFLVFLDDVRKRMIAQDPSLQGSLEGQRKIMKMAGECWRKMSYCQKEEYRNRACSQSKKSCVRCITCHRILPNTGNKKK